MFAGVIEGFEVKKVSVMTLCGNHLRVCHFRVRNREAATYSSTDFSDGCKIHNGFSVSFLIFAFYKVCSEFEKQKVLL